MILATKEQWKYINDVKVSGNRFYTRNATISEDYDENAFRKPQNAPEDALDIKKPETINGLPVRYGNINEDRPYTPCITPDKLFVEFLEKKGSALYHRRYYTSDWFAMSHHCI